MANMFDYLSWRGDLPFSKCPVNPVDALILSTIAYTQFGGLITDDPLHPVFLHKAVEAFFALPEPEQKIRVKRDLDLLLAVAESPRFRNVGLCFYRDEFLPEEESQFAAMTFLLDDGSAFLAFRGTDYSLAGWKEDFNMSFLETVPAQRKAVTYAEEFCEHFGGRVYFGGHSKGGNLAVFAAAKSSPEIRSRIRTVYNLDGPGFGQHMMGDPGYLAVVPKIETYIPQSSIIGMLLEHEEPYTVIRSRQVGILQHDPYSWDLMADRFLEASDLTPDNKFLDRTIKNWLAGMTSEQRSEFVDTVYELLSTGGAKTTFHLLRPQNIRSVIRTLNNDDNVRRLLATELAGLIQSARAAQQEMTAPKQPLLKPEDESPSTGPTA